MTSLMSLMSVTAFSQSITIKGAVYDQTTQDPLIGVSVMVVGTTNGTITDIDGGFQITVPSLDNVKLKLSYIGYKAKEIAVRNTSFLKVSLSEDSEMIDEVVVVGYATQKKESLVGSISTMDNSSLVSMPVTNVAHAMVGKLAGVQIVQPSGEVGRDEADIYVRGLPTFGDARPLIVVDGIVRESFTQIDPNEIQSINVLKDASATAVFGVKGANGVIIVTTRRGTNSKPQISFSGQYAITQPMRIPDPLHSYESSVLRNAIMKAQGNIDEYTALDLVKYRTQASPYSHPDAHWISEVMKDFSSMQQYNVNVSGGNNFLQYFVSGGYLGQDGFYKHDPYTNFTRYNFRSNLDFNISKRFTANFSLGARIEKRQFPGSSKDSSWNIYRGAFAEGGRHNPVYNPDGSLAGPRGSASEYSLIAELNRRGLYRETKSVVEMGLNLKYDLDFITKGLAIRAQLAFDNTGSNDVLWSRDRYLTYYYDMDKDSYTQQGEDSPLTYQWGDSGWFDQKTYGEVGLEYAQTFRKHSVTGLFLANRGLRLIGNYMGYADQGLVGRATYDYDKRYFGEVNIGYNGSENFAKGNRYGFFPAFALGWAVSNESFIADTDIAKVINYFKIRGSLGWVGNDKAGDITKSDYQDKRFIYIQQYYEGGGAYFGSGNNWYGGIYQGNIANEDVTWETGRKFNIGFDSGFFNDLFTLTFDFFQERRSDILTDISGISPGYVGKGFMPANVGIVDNRGFEFDLTHRNRIGNDFNYSIKGVFSYTKNKVIKKADPLGMLPYQREEGYAIGTPLLYKYIGVFESYEDIENSPSQMGLDGNTEVRPGDSKYLDFNNDGVIDKADAFRQGYGEVPEIQYGVTLSMNYKGFDFSALIQGSARSQFKKNWEIMWPYSNADNAYYKHWRFWTPEINGDHEHICFYRNYLNNEPSGGANSFTMGSGDYVRLKSMEIGYTFPKAWTSKILMSSVRIYVSGNNILTWAKEPFLDPDNRDMRGGRMPQTRAFNFGININF